MSGAEIPEKLPQSPHSHSLHVRQESFNEEKENLSFIFLVKFCLRNCPSLMSGLVLKALATLCRDAFSATNVFCLFLCLIFGEGTFSEYKNHHYLICPLLFTLYININIHMDHYLFILLFPLSASSDPFSF